MERLNTKLYEKYRNLKKRQFSEVSEHNAKVEAQIEKYLSVMEGVIEELQNENNQLRAQISSMEERQAEYQQTLMEEARKVEGRSGETERLCGLVSAEDCYNKFGDKEIALEETPCRIPKAGPQGLGEQMKTNSQTRLNKLQCKDVDTIQHDIHQDEPFMPDCCRRNLSSSGDANGKDCAQCVYQMLVESLVGMKFLVESQKDGLCLSVTHQSSGYSFSLTWSRTKDGELGQLFYHVSSLGTIERVALEWMKEDLVFSMAMCHVFFERISRVIGKRT